MAAPTSSQDMTSSRTKTDGNPSTKVLVLPPGYTIGAGPNNVDFLVPDVMVPDLAKSFAAENKQSESAVTNHPNSVSPFDGSPSPISTVATFPFHFHVRGRVMDPDPYTQSGSASCLRVRPHIPPPLSLLIL
jgi:hypothetical protein